MRPLAIEDGLADTDNQDSSDSAGGGTDAVVMERVIL